MTTQVHVRYFAILRERRGVSQETLRSDAADLATLYEELNARHNLSLPRGRLRVAVNDEFADWAQPLREGDQVVFIPPVAGG